MARNERFQELAKWIGTEAGKVAEEKLKNGKEGSKIELDVNEIKAIVPAGGVSIGESLDLLVAAVKENIQLKRLTALSVSQGTVGGYIHGETSPGLGRLGCLVSVYSKEKLGNKSAELQAIVDKIAMNVVASRPKFINRNAVDADSLQKEREILLEQLKNSGKKESLFENIVKGRLNKFYEETCLDEQAFVVGENAQDQASVSKWLANQAKEIGLNPSDLVCVFEFIFSRAEDRKLYYV